MRHIVKLTATFVVDDSNLVDWETPEDVISTEFKKLESPSAGLLCSSIVSDPHPHDENQRKLWEEIKEKYTKKGLFHND